MVGLIGVMIPTLDLDQKSDFQSFGDSRYGIRSIKKWNQNACSRAINGDLVGPLQRWNLHISKLLDYPTEP